MWTEQYKIKEETLTPWWAEEAPMLFGEGEILFAQNGAKLEEVEVSDDPNVIPEGAMHKNKNHLDDLDITPKGIPVGHMSTGEKIESIEDIQNSKGEFILDAEIESSEVIFSKELTDYVEKARKEWHNSKDQNLLLEVGKRVTKELLTNTEDNVNLIPQMEEQIL